MRVLTSGFLGAAVGAILSSAAFFLGAIIDNAAPAEAFGYSLIVAIIGAVLGGLIGAAVSLGDLGIIGGGLAGLLAALAVVAFYVLAFGRTGEYSYFLTESRVLIAGLGAPLILTGSLTAALKNASRRSI